MYNPWAVHQMQILQYASAIEQRAALQGYQPPLMTTEEIPANESDDDDDDDDERKRTLFVANLDERVDNEILYEVFLQAGPIESVRIPKNNNGKQRSFGFVTYTHKCTSQFALKMFSGLKLFRKSITIKIDGAPNNSSPNDCGFMQRLNNNRNNSGNRFDNSALRNSSYPVYHDIDMNIGASISCNSLKMNSSIESSNNRQREDERLFKRASTHSRPHHQSSTPYQRNSRGKSRDRERNHDRDRDRDRDSHRRHSYSDRRSEQRSKNYNRRM